MNKEEMEKYMQRALALAGQGRGRTSPNPMVGAVLVKDNRVIAEGYHHAAGQPHAEVEALRQAGSEARGATIFVTLEPCSHQGRTPPCAPAVVAAGISRAVIGMQDPNPLVAGRGNAILEEGGVEVHTSILEDKCRILNEAFIKHITTGLPFVTLKGATTLDGKIASPTGDSKWITSEASRELVHRLRGEADAVLVGSGTMLNDNPSLTSRIPDKIKDPYRVVLDSSLCTPLDSNFCKLSQDGKSIVVTTNAAPQDKASALEENGCKIIRVAPDETGHPALPRVLDEMGKMDITNLVVEGGGEINFSFIQAGLIDKILLFIAPRLLGGRDSKTFIDGEGFRSIAESVPLADMSITRIGSDILIEAYIKKN